MFGPPSPTQSPLEPARHAAHRVDFTQPAVGKSKRILVVEDDPSTSNALRQLLSACGFEVVTVGTVSGAMQAVDSSFDGIILDLMLPDGDGADVLRTVRASGFKMRVCVTTGVSSPAWLDRVNAMGADCVLQKPIDLAELLTKL